MAKGWMPDGNCLQCKASKLLIFHDAAKHILARKRKFNERLRIDNPEIVANALLLLGVMENMMLLARVETKQDNPD